ncbi:MAG: thermonuclease family protein [Aquiluna sp.]
MNQFLDAFAWCLAGVLCFMSGMELASGQNTSPLRVIDGDTFEVNGEKIRIRGVDTPEIKSKTEIERRAAQAAKEELERLLGSGYSINRIGRDKYGRTVGEVYNRTGEIAEQLIEAGKGKAYLYKLPKAKAEKLLEAQRRAQNKGVGIWEETR